MRTLISLIIIFLSVGLTSCATAPANKSSSVATATFPGATQTWGNRVGVLSNIQDWDLNALIAIRANAQANSANMKWHQSKQDFNILLYGPLGSNAMKLAGQPGNVYLETADGKKFNAASPEALLLQQSGWRIPVSNLYYWIRGLPVPKIAAKKSFDTDNRLTELVQQGWTIQYQRYTSVNHIDVPDKIVLANAEVNVKIVIKNWVF